MTAKNKREKDRVMRVLGKARKDNILLKKALEV